MQPGEELRTGNVSRAAVFVKRVKEEMVLSYK